MTKVLIGEDDEELRILYELFFKKFNYDVIVASSESEIQNHLQTFRPHIAILDIMLGWDDGREIGRTIKQSLPETKVILISARPDLLHTYKEYNADAAIEKPFLMQHVFDKISQLVSETMP